MRKTSIDLERSHHRMKPLKIPPIKNLKRHGSTDRRIPGEQDKNSDSLLVKKLLQKSSQKGKDVNPLDKRKFSFLHRIKAKTENRPPVELDHHQIQQLKLSKDFKLTINGKAPPTERTVILPQFSTSRKQSSEIPNIQQQSGPNLKLAFKNHSKHSNMKFSRNQIGRTTQ